MDADDDGDDPAATGGRDEVDDAAATETTGGRDEVDDAAATETTTPDDHRGPPNRRALAFVVVPLIGLFIASQLGDALGPGLVPDPDEPGSGNPLLLLLLSPRLRWQVAVVNYLNPVVFLLVGTLRLLAADPPFYLLGYWYGDSAVRWMERQAPGSAKILRRSEKYYGKAAYPLVAIAPNNLICLLAGSSRMRPAVFFALNVGGTLVRLWLVIQFGKAFEDQIDAVLDWIGRYRWWLVGLSSAVIGTLVWRQARSGTGELGQLRELEHEIEREREQERDQGET